MRTSGDFTKTERAAITAAKEEVLAWRVEPSPLTRHRLRTALIQGGIPPRLVDALVGRIKRRKSVGVEGG